MLCAGAFGCLKLLSWLKYEGLALSSVFTDVFKAREAQFMDTVLWPAEKDAELHQLVKLIGIKKGVSVGEALTPLSVLPRSSGWKSAA